MTPSSYGCAAPVNIVRRSNTRGQIPTPIYLTLPLYYGYSESCQQRSVPISRFNFIKDLDGRERLYFLNMTILHLYLLTNKHYTCMGAVCIFVNYEVI